MVNSLIFYNVIPCNNAWTIEWTDGADELAYNIKDLILPRLPIRLLRLVDKYFDFPAPCFILCSTPLKVGHTPQKPQ